MNRKGFANMIRIILFVVVAGAVGYFAVTKRPTQLPSIEHQQPQNNAPAQPVVNTQPSSNSQALPKVTKPTGVFAGTRSKALDFIKSHSNVYDKVWKWEGFSYQRYTQFPNKEKEELNYQWFENNESEITKDEKGNTVVTWAWPFGCTMESIRSTGCYSLGFSVHFDDSSAPIYIRVIDIGGIE